MNFDLFAFHHCLGLLLVLLASLINGSLGGSGSSSSGNEPGLQNNEPNHGNVPNQEDNTPSLDITIDDRWRSWPEYERLLDKHALKDGIELPRFTISLYPVSMPNKTTAIKAETQAQADGTDMATFKLNREDWPKLKRIEERQIIAGENGHQEHHKKIFGHGEVRPMQKGYELAIKVNRSGQVILRQLDLYEKQEQEYTFSILPEDITQVPLEDLNFMANLGPKPVQHEVAESLNMQFKKLIQRGEKCVQLIDEAIEELTRHRVNDFALEQQFWENTWRRLYLKNDYIQTLSSYRDKELDKTDQEIQEIWMNLVKSITKEHELLKRSQKNFLNCRNGITWAQGWAREQTNHRIKMEEAKRPPKLCFRPGEFYRFLQAERQRNEQIFQTYYGQAMATFKIKLPTTGQGRQMFHVDNGDFPVPQYLKLKSRVLDQTRVAANNNGALHKRKEHAFTDLTFSSHGIEEKQTKMKRMEVEEEHKN